jgi:aerobic carbon-monoxide dehydrogenase small subunit
MAASISLRVNGQNRTVTTERDRSLLEVLREDLLLTGPRYGCGEGACGCCSVLVDGKRMFSCSTPVSEVEGKSITTIEGLGSPERLHPMQQAFLEEAAFQCAYCTPGMIIAAISLLNRKPTPTDAEIREGMNGNLCRCCAQPEIVRAVRRGAELLARK